MGAVHLAHAARTDGREDFIRPQFIAWLSLTHREASSACVTAHPDRTRGNDDQ